MIARSIPAELPYFRDQALKDIAAVQPDTDALATLKEVHYDYFRAAGLVELAKRQAAAKRIQHLAGLKKLKDLSGNRR